MSFVDIYRHKWQNKNFILFHQGHMRVFEKDYSIQVFINVIFYSYKTFRIIPGGV